MKKKIGTSKSMKKYGPGGIGSTSPQIYSPQIRAPTIKSTSMFDEKHHKIGPNIQALSSAPTSF